MTESWNFQTSPYQRLKSNFRVLHLIPIFLGLMCYTKIRKDENKFSIIDLTSYSQSDQVLGENSLQSVVKMSQSYFLCNRKSWKFSWNELFFPSLPTYFLFHNTCLQSKNWWTLWNDQILKFSNFTIIEAEVKFKVLHLIPIILGLMCYTKIRKNENKLSIIDLTSYSQSDHILGENSLQSVVKMSQSYFLCNRKSWKFSWNKLFFPSLPSYFLFHNTCFQSKNW